MNDPRNPYSKLLTVEYLSNMVNGRRVLYNNQPVEVLKKLTAASLRDNEVRDMICFLLQMQKTSAASCCHCWCIYRPFLSFGVFFPL